MKKEKVRVSMGVQFSIIPWILMYPLIGWLIYWRVEKQFHSIINEEAVAKSLETYMQSVYQTLLVAGILSLLWWMMAYNRGMLRKAFETSTIVFGAVFVACVAAAIAIGPARLTILDNLGKRYGLWSEWSILGAFAFNLYLFSPMNVRQVVFVKGILGRGLMALLAVALSSYCLWRG